MPSTMTGAGPWTGRGWHLRYPNSHGKAPGVTGRAGSVAAVVVVHRGPRTTISLLIRPVQGVGGSTELAGEAVNEVDRP